MLTVCSMLICLCAIRQTFHGISPGDNLLNTPMIPSFTAVKHQVHGSVILHFPVLQHERPL